MIPLLEIIPEQRERVRYKNASSPKNTSDNSQQVINNEIKSVQKITSPLAFPAFAGTSRHKFVGSTLNECTEEVAKQNPIIIEITATDEVFKRTTSSELPIPKKLKNFKRTLNISLDSLQFLEIGDDSSISTDSKASISLDSTATDSKASISLDSAATYSTDSEFSITPEYACEAITSFVTLNEKEEATLTESQKEEGRGVRKQLCKALNSAKSIKPRVATVGVFQYEI